MLSKATWNRLYSPKIEIEGFTALNEIFSTTLYFCIYTFAVWKLNF